MHTFIAFSLARRRKVPRSRIIPTCLCQGPDQVPEEVLQFAYFLIKFYRRSRSEE